MEDAQAADESLPKGRPIIFSMLDEDRGLPLASLLHNVFLQEIDGYQDRPPALGM